MTTEAAFVGELDWKTWVAPAVAAVVLLVWFFAIKPRLESDAPAVDRPAAAAEAPATGP